MYHQLIYRSRFVPAGAGPASSLSSIVAASERNNTRDQITGYLIFDKTCFMQILEGDKGDVQHTFERIALDPRHTALTTLYQGEISQRIFPDWSMGGVVRSPEMQAVFQRHGCLSSLEKADLGERFIALARDIADWEHQRQHTRGLSAR